MIKVKWLRSHPMFSYFPGDTGVVTPANAEMLLAGGYVIIIPEAELIAYPLKKDPEIVTIPEPVNTLPEDMPARDKLFAAGFDTAEKVKEVSGGDGLLDVGISVSMLKKIKKYFKG